MNFFFGGGCDARGRDNRSNKSVYILHIFWLYYKLFWLFVLMFYCFAENPFVTIVLLHCFSYCNKCVRRAFYYTFYSWFFSCKLLWYIFLSIDPKPVAAPASTYQKPAAAPSTYQKPAAAPSTFQKPAAAPAAKPWTPAAPAPSGPRPFDSGVAPKPTGVGAKRGRLGDAVVSNPVAGSQNRIPVCSSCGSPIRFEKLSFFVGSISVYKGCHFFLFRIYLSDYSVEYL